MKKLKMESKDILNENIERVAELFPNVLVESEDGKKIDFDILRQELSDDIVDGPRERYHLDFPGKREAIIESNRKTTKTLRPIKDKSVNFDTTKNIYIEGDNLEALKILQESYLGKIKCIYIDPPYNTGNDFVYNDEYAHKEKEEMRKEGRLDDDDNIITSKDINNESKGRYHSDWLKMMYPRLKLARNLLSDDGVIFISIDDNEVDNLRKLCDEVFGENDFLGQIVQNKGNAQNDAKNIQKNHEYVLVYAKQRKIVNGVEESLLHNYIESVEEVFEDENNRFYYKGAGLVTGGAGGTLNNRPNLGYTIYYNKETKDKFAIQDYDIEKARVSNSEKEVYIDNNELLSKGYIKIRAPKKGNQLGCWTWDINKFNNEKDNILITDNYSVCKKIFVDKTKIEGKNGKYYAEILKETKNIRSCLDFSTAKGTTVLVDLFGNKYFDNPKNLDLLCFLINSLLSSKDIIILDFFSGSATTAHAVMKLNAEDGGNRQFIMVQLPEATDEGSEAYKAGFKNICDIGEERIRRAGKKILEEIKEADANKSSIKIDDNGSASIEENDIGANDRSALDIGFRVYKIDDSNMKDIYYKPNELSQENVLDLISNVKEDRTALDLLTQVMLNLGLTLDLKIEEKRIGDNLYYFVEDNALVACFDNKINLDTLKEALVDKPLKILCKESSFEKDQDKINFNERIKKYSPETEKYII